MEKSAEAVWQVLNGRLARFIRHRVPDEYAADDLLQDVYLKIHTRIDTLRDDQRVQAWVYQIARNAIYDYYREQMPVTPIGDWMAEPEGEAEDEVSLRLRESVRAMIMLLPDEYREALLLTEYEGLTQKELAERLGISLSGAKSRVQRGRKLLRELLLACCHFEFDRRGKVINYVPRCGCCDNCAD